MGIFDKLFQREKKDPAEAFWQWFGTQEATFFQVMKNKGDVVERVLDELTPRLHKVNPGFFSEIGMASDDVAEIIITAEGDVKNFVFVEHLVRSAPTLSNWKFTALKQPAGWRIHMNGCTFDEHTLSFYSEPLAEYPDEICLKFVHRDFSEEQRKTMDSGTSIFLSNLLGELATATQVDTFEVVPAPSGQELIPIRELPAYLAWREKEFVEKYSDGMSGEEFSQCAVLEGTINGLPLIAMVNQDLLRWDSKPSHPWMTVIDIAYTVSNNGMPSTDSSEAMNAFEDQLPKQTGWLNLGRETGDGHRKIYIASNEFRKISEVVANLIAGHRNLKIDYSITRDKYWLALKHLQPHASV
ncbi:MAG TPA: DUF695 domain-containing protein [Dinghuibacter sp.]|uniref:DUF695 domain-containing protein n=1 Tax=Dinghuibacter sp. TaxID=2024697 RepID=UPI002C73DCDF|nr:DUF695 domain-containing protein [Dinghuibacter sp.]HTJ11721.1 DUF695 domain-containing protein [Dinghuibacter sp.]